MSPEPNLLCLEEDVFLMDSPCTSLRTARNIQQQQQLGGSQPQRYYLPFGQNSNELSMERKRLHRITLQAVQQEECSRQQQLGLMGPRTGGGQSAVASLAIGGPLETPKNGGKVLGSIDVNIPVNGSRLVHPYQQQYHHHQQHARTSRMRQSVLVQPSIGQQQPQQPIGTRKRRAEEGEERLNKKDRIWVCADIDRAIHFDDRCILSQLEAEKLVQVSAAQIRRQQQNVHGKSGEQGVDESARTRFVEWLNEVCQEEKADFVVFPLAVSLLDRILAARFVPRRNLQALGAACLLIASKIKAPQPIQASKLADSTAKVVKTEELLDWEMIVVNQLQWNLLQSTAFEFFDQLLVRSPVLEAMREDFAFCLHRMQRALSLSTQLPSAQAAACLLFCALRSQRQHLLYESEQTIRRVFGMDLVKALIPLLGEISAAVGQDESAIEADAQRFAGWTDQQRMMRPPSSKRMSLDHSASDQAQFSHSERRNSTIGAERGSAAKDVNSAPKANSELSSGNSPPGQVDDESSRSSSNSSNEGTKTKAANDSGYRSSETISPLQLQLLDRKAKDFGPLW